MQQNASAILPSPWSPRSIFSSNYAAHRKAMPRARSGVVQCARVVTIAVLNSPRSRAVVGAVVRRRRRHAHRSSLIDRSPAIAVRPSGSHLWLGQGLDKRLKVEVGVGDVLVHCGS